MLEKKRIIILGAGFGGIYTYLGLKKHLKNFEDVEVVLINKKNYFLFVPMIHEVATGNLEPSSVVQPIRQAIDAGSIRFIEGSVTEVNLDQENIVVDSKGNKLLLKYDYLVSALGSTTDFFGVPGAERCYLLKDLDDAQNIKIKIIDSFESASVINDQAAKERLLSFVIIGGGPTGVELASELADLLNHEIKKAYPELYPLAQVHLIHSRDKLMCQVDEWFHHKAKAILLKMGVRLHLNHKVSQITEQGACYDDSEWIETSNIFWTAGVKATPLKFVGARANDVKRRENDGRIGVGLTLQVPGFDNIFVVGDQMCLTDKETGQPYPMRAQFAVREGLMAGYNIAQLIARGDNAKLKEFKWKDQGFIVSLGKGGALAQAFGIKFSGIIAWWLYRTVYLFKLIGARAKLKTVYEWTINLFLPRDISKL